MATKSMLATILCVCATFSHAQADEMPWVKVAKDKKSFVLEPSGKPFTLWGFNYDHDTQGRLIEDYWDKEWDKVEAHFGQMKKHGASVVRIHLQVGKFMDAADKPNEKALDRLTKLALAEKERIYLDLTGLGCYHKADVTPGTTSSPRRTAGTPRHASGKPWRAAVPRVPPSSVMT